MADSCFQIRHLHRRQRGLESLITYLQPCAIDCLLQRVTGEHAKSMRHSSLLRRLANTARDFVDNYVVVGGVSTQQASETDDGIVFFRFSEGAGSRRDFEGAGDAHDVNILPVYS